MVNHIGHSGVWLLLSELLYALMAHHSTYRPRQTLVSIYSGLIIVYNVTRWIPLTKGQVLRVHRYSSCCSKAAERYRATRTSSTVIDEICPGPTRGVLLNAQLILPTALLCVIVAIHEGPAQTINRRLHPGIAEASIAEASK